MKLFFKSLLISTLILLAGCNKEKPADTPPATAAEPVVLKNDIATLHKAEDLKKSAQTDAIEQHKQIDAATQ